MTPRALFARTLSHRQAPRVPLDFGGCPLSSIDANALEALLRVLGFSAEPADAPRTQSMPLPEQLLRYFQVDTRGVGYILAPHHPSAQNISPTRRVDCWGIERRFTGLYWDIVSHPLRGADLAALEAYPWPRADAINWREIETLARRAKYLHEQTDKVVCGEHPVYGVFELGCWMCGFDDFLMKMALEPAFVHRFFEIVLAYQRQVIDVYYGALGPYLHYTTSGDDFATQQSLFVSPAMFREMIAPYLRERIAHTKRRTSAAFLHHSCGSVFPIIPDLIGCGVEILNPIQPLAARMEPCGLKRAFGGQLVLHGGLDTQQALPAGDRESIRQTVHRTIGTLGKDGGYIFAAAHNIQADVPPENVVHMLEAAAAYRF